MATEQRTSHAIKLQRTKLTPYIMNKQPKLVLGQKYYVLSSRWLDRWKHYVDYDNEPENAVVGAEGPGPIDNSDLESAIVPGALRVGLCEGQDYMLILDSDYESLRQSYSSTGDFLRNVMESTERGVYQVDMYPFRVNILSCMDSTGEPPVSGQGTKVLWISKRKDLRALLAEVKSSVGVNYNFRCWLRVQSSASSDTLVPPNSKFGEDYRDITPAYQWNDHEKGWFMLGMPETTSLADIASNFLGDVAELDMMVEKQLSGKWPRQNRYDSWLNGLKANDILDCKCDSSWVEALVISVDSVRVTVRPLGYDGVNAQSRLAKSQEFFAPLYQKSKNWRISDPKRVSVKCGVSTTGAAIWREATVKVVNYEDKTITVEAKKEANNASSYPDMDCVEKTVKLYSEEIRPLPEESLGGGSSGAKAARVAVADPGIDDDDDDKYPKDNYNRKITTTYDRYNDYYGYGRRHTPGSPCGAVGTVGLANLGNTCFMNSMLQCISNTYEFTELFLTDRFKDDLNRSSALSHGGKIADAYASLLKDMWSGKYSACSPTEFKQVIGEFAPQFAGYQQQDSQEFMLFLLDGLHEDLNRVKKKPYLESKDSEGRPDEIVAAEAWSMHKQREDSIVVDTFHGQLKSHVTCKNCQKVSVKFDAFSSLSLPLPVKNEKPMKAIYCPMYEKAKRVVFDMPPTATVGDYCDKLSAFLQTLDSATRYFQAATYDDYYGSVRRNLESSFGLSDIGSYSQLIIFEVLPGTKQPKEFPGSYYSSFSASDNSARYVTIDVINKFKCASQYGTTDKKSFGFPSRICVPLDANNSDVHEEVDRTLRRYIRADSCYLRGGMIDSPTRIPYTLLTKSDYYGDTALSRDNSEFRYTHELMAMWSADGRTPENFDFEQCKLGELETSTDDSESGEERSKRITLRDCFNKFAENEQLPDSETLYCSHCKEHNAPLKKMDLWRAPNVLIIQLKRFQYIPGQYFVHRDKISDLVEFPVEGLDLSEFIKGPVDATSGSPIYDLFGVSEHSGGLGGGHYTACCRNAKDGRWYDFNDSSVSVAREDSIVSTQAYVLFYRRRGTYPIAGLAPTTDGGVSAAGTAEYKDMYKF